MPPVRAPTWSYSLILLLFCMPILLLYFLFNEDISFPNLLVSSAVPQKYSPYNHIVVVFSVPLILSPPDKAKSPLYVLPPCKVSITGRNNFSVNIIIKSLSIISVNTIFISFIPAGIILETGIKYF